MSGNVSDLILFKKVCQPLCGDQTKVRVEPVRLVKTWNGVMVVKIEIDLRYIFEVESKLP